MSSALQPAARRVSGRASYTHLEAFVRGIVRLTDVVYYLSLICISLFLTYRVLEAQRWR
jgi:hypothetical protein